MDQEKRPDRCRFTDQIPFVSGMQLLNNGLPFIVDRIIDQSNIISIRSGITGSGNTDIASGRLYYAFRHFFCAFFTHCGIRLNGFRFHPEELDLHSIELVIFPGGMPGSVNLDAHPFSDAVIDAVIKNGGRIAAICAAPLVLGRRGLLEGKRATCYPGFEGELRGAHVCGAAVVTDGNITTARGMGAALAFAEELVRLTAGEKVASELSAGIMKG